MTVNRLDADLVVSWSSSAPALSYYAVYLDRVHVWTGTQKRCVLPYPAAGRRVLVEVGTVAASERHRDLAGQLPTPPGGGSRLTLDWTGGSFLSGTIARYDIFLGSVPGGAVNYATPVGTVAAYSQGTGPTDGWGQGQFGFGALGFASASYSWSIGGLPSGTWNAAVVPIDAAGNAGTGAVTSGAVNGPPWPPARNAAGKRVTAVVKTEYPESFGGGPFGSGGFGDSAGWGLGTFGGEEFGIGSGGLATYVSLAWLASPGA